MEKNDIANTLANLEKVALNELEIMDVCADMIDVQRKLSYAIDGVLLGLCNEGSCEFMTNQEIKHADPNTFFIVFPKQIFSIRQVSPDLRGTLVHVPREIFPEMQPHIQHEHLYEILSNSCIQLPPATFGELESIISILKRHTDTTKDSKNRKLVSTLIEAIILIINVASATSLHEPRKLNRQELLTQAFFTSLLKHVKTEHSVEFYANEAYVTPKYLSTIVRQITGQPAQEWISRVTVFSAKRLLKTSDLTVAQIADELHFSSASAFIRFFKQHTGITPLAYRY